MHQDPNPKSSSPAQRQAARRRRLTAAGYKTIKIFVSSDVHALLLQQVHARHMPAGGVIELALRELSVGSKP